MTYELYADSDFALEIAKCACAGKPIRFSHPSASVGDELDIVSNTKDGPKKSKRSLIVVGVQEGMVLPVVGEIERMITTYMKEEK